MTSIKTCPHCNESYEGQPYSLHFNECGQRHSSDVSMFPDHHDYATEKLSGHKELYDLQKTCQNCLQSYNGSWEDHADRCSVVRMQRAQRENGVSLFAEKKIKTQAEEIAELKAEVAELKKALKNKK
jgi:hypothetical protein